MNANEKLVKLWVEKIIIGLNLCPFAKQPLEAGLIHISSSNETDPESMMKFFLEQIDLIQKSSPTEISNSLIVYPKVKTDFYSFYEWFCACQDILEELKIEQLFQIVCFHPEFTFQDLPENKRVNLVNRSPFPLIHILRSDEVARVSNDPEVGEKISFENEKRLEEFKTKDLKFLFNPFLPCKHVPD